MRTHSNARMHYGKNCMGTVGTHPSDTLYCRDQLYMVGTVWGHWRVWWGHITRTRNTVRTYCASWTHYMDTAQWGHTYWSLTVKDKLHCVDTLQGHSALQGPNAGKCWHPALPRRVSKFSRGYELLNNENTYTNSLSEIGDGIYYNNNLSLFLYAERYDLLN